MPHRFLTAVLLAIVALPALQVPLVAAQVRRCTGPDGGTIYTDRSCQAVGASESTPRPGAATSHTPRFSCQRHLRGLIQELGFAIHQRDTNRLIGLYHWQGLSQSGGYRILDRLDGIAQRPLIDITAQRPAQPVLAQQQLGFSGWVSARDIPTAAPERAPTSLRVDQSGNDGGTVHTVFGLRRHLGCWWLSL
ncbi:MULTISPECIES: hypothetical protein [Luteimonas]|uniref:DUF4124 domain-containing protein n=1 Tax=Luteimonas chenhongjianii TaxID=2006110 RepID=A0A290XHF7_9GAMM|nr:MULTISPECIES: hypothetical protein [Luteimonas]ATD68376.1 hypothetical protein CNR27_13825 [Luteimonas chenhongjianii]RPD87939.1 hypothetical protein EGK76_01755 [Luteimonas sp. 100069]